MLTGTCLIVNVISHTQNGRSTAGLYTFTDDLTALVRKGSLLAKDEIQKNIPSSVFARY